MSEMIDGCARSMSGKHRWRYSFPAGGAPATAICAYCGIHDDRAETGGPRLNIRLAPASLQTDNKV